MYVDPDGGLRIVCWMSKLLKANTQEQYVTWQAAERTCEQF